MTDQYSVGAGHRVDPLPRPGFTCPIPAWEPAAGPEGLGSGDPSDDSRGADDAPEGPAAGSSFGAGIEGGAASSAEPSGTKASGASDEAKPARRKRRSRKKPVARDEADPGADAPVESRSDSSDSSDSSDEDGSGPDDEDSPARKRRRRGSRGGRRRKRQDDDAAVAVDVIPGEDDDLDVRPGTDADDDAPEPGGRKKKSRRKSNRKAEPESDGSDATERSDADEPDEDSGGKKKRRRRRSRRKAGTGDDESGERSERDAGEGETDGDADGSAAMDADERGPERKRKRTRSKKKAGSATAARTKTAEEKAAEAEAMRTQTIAVNSVEPEERRVAVYEGDRIIDFLMNAESQKTLVNDIYRGRVVNLEPAIGAAFIDFGQGRNGFLHTSDVLPIYGERDFELEDLLTGGHHDEEGDHDADWSEEADALDDVPSEDDDESDEAVEPEGEAEGESEDDDSEESDDDGEDEEPAAPKGRRSLRSRSRRPASSMVASLDDDGAGGDDGGGDAGDGDTGTKRKARKRRPSRKAAAKSDDDGDSGAPVSDGDETTKKRSTKRKRSRKKATTRASADEDGAEAEGAGRKKSKRKAARKTERKAKSKKKASSKRKSKKTSKARGARSRGRSERRPQRERRPIDQLLRVGDPVVVQVTKDAIGDKGPTLTTYISMPGRYLVLMPSMSRTGVSRKIPDEKERKRLKRILASLNTPPDMGVIVRTAGVGRTKADLQRDLDYLLGLWEAFGKKLRSSRGPAPLYLESDVATRTLRDLFNRRTKEVLVDDLTVHDQMVGFAEQLMPEHVGRIKKHEGDRPLFQHAGIEQDFERIFARRVDLPSGGSIVFDQAEALVAIDVNSGRTRTDSYDFEDIALKTNLEAVPEIARQIRLRDLGGIIVCDFIDMMRSSSNRQVERALRDALADDRARSKLGRISQFGLLELTRQRLGPGTHKKVFQACPRCRGTARIRTVESRAQAILRRLGGAVVQKGFTKVEVRAHPEVVQYLKEDLWDWVRALEHRSEKQIELTPIEDQPEDSVLRYLRADGREVRPGGRRKR